MSDGQWSSHPPQCERAQCPILPDIENGFVLDPQKTFFFGDVAKVQCHWGYRLEGSPVITCGPDQNFTNTPMCTDVKCSASTCDAASTICTNTAGGFFCKCKTGFEPNFDCRPVGDLGLSSSSIPDTSIKVSGTETGYHKNMHIVMIGWWIILLRAFYSLQKRRGSTFHCSIMSVSCHEVGRPLRATATAGFRQCVYDPQEGKLHHWLSGSPPSCPRIDCGPPIETPESSYGYYADTKCKASFFFGCEETFTLAGKTSKNDNVIRCQEDGTWDFGDLRCEGPVCEDPGRPPDGAQIAATYEQGAEVRFSCLRPGYEPFSTDPIKCDKNAECKTIKPIGLTSGEIPESSINATSQRINYEAKVE